MRGIRIAFLFVLGLIPFVPSVGTLAPPLLSPRESVSRTARFLSPAEELADRLRHQGKDPRRFLFWEGYPPSRTGPSLISRLGVLTDQRRLSGELALRIAKGLRGLP